MRTYARINAGPKEEKIGYTGWFTLCKYVLSALSLAYSANRSSVQMGIFLFLRINLCCFFGSKSSVWLWSKHIHKVRITSCEMSCLLDLKYWHTYIWIHFFSVCVQCQFVMNIWCVYETCAAFDIHLFRWFYVYHVLIIIAAAALLRRYISNYENKNFHWPLNGKHTWIHNNDRKKNYIIFFYLGGFDSNLERCYIIQK